MYGMIESFFSDQKTFFFWLYVYICIQWCLYVQFIVWLIVSEWIANGNGIIIGENLFAIFFTLTHPIYNNVDISPIKTIPKLLFVAMNSVFLPSPQCSLFCHSSQFKKRERERDIIFLWAERAKEVSTFPLTTFTLLPAYFA